MSKLTFQANRAAGFSAAVVLVVVMLIVNMTMASGLIPGLSPETDTKQDGLITGEKMKVTIEGQFVDRNGDLITRAEKPGIPAELISDECYSYLIGYRSGFKKLSGLRRILAQFLLLGGADGVGAQIGLTTDNGLQEYCYDVLGKREGSVIVMDPHTGEILAMTSRSSAEMGFDADLFRNAEKYAVYNSYPAFWYNRSLFAEDPPGSTFKILTAAAMLECGMGDYIYDDLDGTYKVGGSAIHNVKHSVYGPGVTLEKALNKSINVYFASAAVEMGMHRMEQIMSRFRINEDIVTDFGRFRSVFNLENRSNKGELAQAGFGQGGLAMSPIHVSMIMGTVMNDGIMVTPHVIREIYDDGADRIDELWGESEEMESHEVFSQTTADTLKQYLHSTAVGYGFTEENFGMVYAKTGTADQRDGKNHVYMLMGLETEARDYVILIDVRNVDGTSSTLKDSAASILTYILDM